MPLTKLDPPGTWCQNQAVFELLDGVKVRTFLDVGCGAGDLSKALCDRSYTGIGLDLSEAAIRRASETLREPIEAGRYCLSHADVRDASLELGPVDFAISLCVLEHIDDDVEFLRCVSKHVRPGGYLIISVPGRRDCWGIEDETVGHKRRYERGDFAQTLEAADLDVCEIRSIGVPVSNLLFRLSNRAIGRSQVELQKRSWSHDEQTAHSGVREIPGKTMFPSWCRLILNRYAMYPVLVTQRLFYSTNLGLVLLALAQKRQ
jgi:SAM-dependent methyltransferase